MKKTGTAARIGSGIMPTSSGRRHHLVPRRHQEPAGGL